MKKIFAAQRSCPPVIRMGYTQRTPAPAIASRRIANAGPLIFQSYAGDLISAVPPGASSNTNHTYLFFAAGNFSTYAVTISRVPAGQSPLSAVVISAVYDTVPGNTGNIFYDSAPEKFL